MGYASRSGRAYTDARNPEAFAVCDRCGIWYNHKELAFQYQYAGVKLINLGILVCPTCLDIPSQFLKTIILPPDPVPIQNPRPEAFVASEGPIQPAPQQPTNASELYSQSIAGQGLPIPIPPDVDE